MATAGSRRPSRKGCPNRAAEFKRELAAAACGPGISVAKLAFEHGVNANLLFKWRREYRAGKYGAPAAAHMPTPHGTDVPIVTNSSEPTLRLLPVQASIAEANVGAASAYIEVVFGHASVRIHGAPATVALRAVLDTLARHS
jgi:transposase